MSRSTNNLFPPGSWPSQIDLDADAEHGNNWNQRPPMTPQIFPYRPPPPGTLEERVRTGSHHFIGGHVPRQPPPPGRITFPDNEMVPEVNPRPRQFVQQDPPRINLWPMRPPPLEEQTRLNQEEQKKALKKLSKQVYHPPPKRKSQNWCLYYRDISNSFKGKEAEKDEDEQRCPICWEDFVANEELVVTPCKHLFHEDCILPWVKSHGQCPVCRFTICERRREHVPPMANVAVNDLLVNDPIAFITAMQEAFQIMTIPRQYI